MIRFMYGLDYPAGVEAESPMLLQANMYQLGDKYMVPKLKDRAKSEFDKAVRLHWYTKDFLPTIESAYTTTPRGDRGLCDPVVKIVHENIDLLMENEDFVTVLHTVVISRPISRRNWFASSKKTA